MPRFTRLGALSKRHPKPRELRGEAGIAVKLASVKEMVLDRRERTQRNRDFRQSLALSAFQRRCSLPPEPASPAVLERGALGAAPAARHPRCGSEDPRLQTRC